jgi:four helix bundle protein
MANINQLIVYQETRELIRLVQPITEGHAFGDLNNQIRRAVISVASNICEGAGSGSDRQFSRYCKLARASVNEAMGQLQILGDLGIIDAQHPSIALSDRIGRRLSCLIRRLEPG